MRGIALLFVSGVVVAAGAALAADEATPEVGLERIADASPEELREIAEAASKSIEQSEANLGKLPSGPRAGSGQASDASLDCVSGPLATVGLLKAQADAARAALATALDAGNVERAASEVRKLSVAARESAALAADAERCALGVTETAGTSRTTAGGGVGDPDGDTRAAASDVLDFTTDPPSSSPF